jgi:hypothetical protein
MKAAFPGIAVQTAEEKRIGADVLGAAKEAGKALVQWTATEGMKNIFPATKAIANTEDPVAALAQRLPNTVYMFCDLANFPFDRDPILPRALRDLLTWAPSEGSCIIIIGPSFRPHPTLEKLIVVTDYALPSKADLTSIAESIAKSAGKKFNGDAEDVLRALSGLSTTEAENALALSIVESGKFCPEIIYREKVAGVKKSGLLEIVDPDPRGLDAIGGLDVLKGWITKRKRAFTKEAEEYGLPAPKGIMLVGVPGSGKSLSAKAIGTALGVPTVKLDIGALFNSLVGESESRTREALKLAEAMSPCVLWTDEIEKGLAGSSGSGSGDSGVTKRVFGTVISWMQERRRPVFLVATANDVTGLPPELLRKGRFDEVFAVDLPNEDERTAIFKIHLRKRKRDALADAITPDSVAVQTTKEFTGSEIENVIESAMFEAFDEGRDITLADLMDAAVATTPLAQTAKEKIDAIREWASTRARFASTVKEKTVNVGQRVIGGQ